MLIPGVLGEIILKYSTGKLTTFVSRCSDDSFRWYQQATSAACPDAALTLPPESAREAVESLNTDVVRFVFGSSQQGRLVYSLPDSVSVAWRMLNGSIPPVRYLHLFHELGVSIRRLHRVRLPEGVAGAPAWLRGLRSWLASPGPSDAERYLFAVLGRR